MGITPLLHYYGTIRPCSLPFTGIGLTFTFKSSERRKPDTIVLREVEDLRLTMELSAIWREDNKLPALKKFVEIVRNQVTGISHI